jgi:hypothetical protein
MRIEFWKLQPGPVDDLPRCDQPRGGRTTAILAAVSMPCPDCRQSGTMALMGPRPLSLLPFCIENARNALPSCCIRKCPSWRAVAQVAKASLFGDVLDADISTRGYFPISTKMGICTDLDCHIFVPESGTAFRKMFRGCTAQTANTPRDLYNSTASTEDRVKHHHKYWRSRPDFDSN